MSLTARYLEAHGIPTVIIGSAWDIVEWCGVPRFLFADRPLGNPCGHPWDAAKAFDASAPASVLVPVATCGHPAHAALTSLVDYTIARTG